MSNKVTGASGKGSGSEEGAGGGASSVASVVRCGVLSTGVCGEAGFFGDGLRLLSELGVAGVKLSSERSPVSHVPY